jgi:hypothetical protein
MTEENWRAGRRAQLWERLCRLSDELQELTFLWWDEDPQMASWEPGGEGGHADDSSQAPRSRRPKRPRR